MFCWLYHSTGCSSSYFVTVIEKSETPKTVEDARQYIYNCVQPSKTAVLLTFVTFVPGGRLVVTKYILPFPLADM